MEKKNLGNETKKKKKKSKNELRLIDRSMEMETKTKRRRLIEDDTEFLPPEIITEILSRLPADSAIRCRGICKQWRSLIDHPSFRDTHTRQVISSSLTSNSERLGNYLIPSFPASSFGCFLYALQENRKFHLQFVEYNDNVDDDDDETLVPEFKPSKPITGHPFPFYHNCVFPFFFNKWGNLMISSCNGLVFMGSSNPKPNSVNDMFICNLFTREYLNLSLGTEVERWRRTFRSKGGMSYGFGYLHSTNEYKVVSIYYQDLYGEKGEVNVYTLGSGRWRNKGEIPYCVYSELHPGFFANGAIHWFTNNTKKKKIISFDLADEEFRVVVPLPPQAQSANHVDELGVLGGCLCVTRSDKTRCEIPKDIWVLSVHTKEKRKNKFSWKKRFSIPWERITSGVKPYAILKSGKILLHGGTGLISYDPKTKAFSEDKQSIFCDPWLKVIPYTKSFVSLKALGEKNAKCWGFVAHDRPQALAHVRHRKTEQQLRYKRQFKALAQQFRYNR